MMTLRQLAAEPPTLPTRTTWFPTLACKEFEQRVGQLKSPRGEKTEAVLAAVDRQVATFRVADLRAECPGVGLDLIRRVLARLQKEKKIKSLGTGRSAKWQKIGN